MFQNRITRNLILLKIESIQCGQDSVLLGKSKNDVPRLMSANAENILMGYDTNLSFR